MPHQSPWGLADRAARNNRGTIAFTTPEET